RDVLHRECARHPSFVTPEIEQMRCRKPVLQQQDCSDSDARDFQRRRRLGLEPNSRPDPLGGGERLSAELRELHVRMHLIFLTACTEVNPGPSGWAPLRWSSGVNAFSFTCRKVMETGRSAACSRQ